VGVVAFLEVGGQGATLADPSGGSFDAAGDFGRLLPFFRSLSMLGRIDEHGSVRFTPAELFRVRDEASGLLHLTRDGPERRGLMRLIALADRGSQLPGSILHVVGD
jgi:hypothetical protein